MYQSRYTCCDLQSNNSAIVIRQIPTITVLIMNSLSASRGALPSGGPNQIASPTNNALSGSVPDGAVGGLSRPELLVLLQSPVQMNSRTDRDAILAPANLFRYFDVIVAGEDHAANAGNRWLYSGHQSLDSDVAIFSERLPRGTDNAKIADIATDAGKTPAQMKEFFFRASCHEIVFHDAGRVVHGIESCPLTRLAYEIALQGDALYESLIAPHPGKSAKRVLEMQLRQLSEGMATSPVFQKLAVLGKQPDIEKSGDGALHDLRQNLARIDKKQAVIAYAGAALRGRLDDAQAMALGKDCRKATLDLHVLLQDVAANIFNVYEAMARIDAAFSSGQVPNTHAISTKTMNLLPDLQSPHRPEQNAPFVEAIAEKYVYVATAEDTMPKAFVIVGAAHAIKAVDSNGSRFPDVGAHLTQRCAVPAERILNVVLGNAATYDYDFHRSPPYVASEKCPILPHSVWNARMPLLGRTDPLLNPVARTT